MTTLDQKPMNILVNGVENVDNNLEEKSGITSGNGITGGDGITSGDGNSLEDGKLEKNEIEIVADAEDNQAYDTEIVITHDGNPPRKRSKVSRACDSCRRKKIRCNAEYSSSLQKVTKICNNCMKNDENCTFSRTPLKRGPSKGYIRDLEEKLDSSKSKDTFPQSQSQSQFNSSLHPLHHQPLPFPLNHLKPVSSPGNTSPIILPPLVGYGSKILPPKLAQNSTSSSTLTLNGLATNNQTPTNNSNPSSPRSSAITGLLNTENPSFKNSSPPIQGPFWKVPYEMPVSSSRKSSIPTNNVSVANNATPNYSLGSSRRKFSIDSISSTSTNGSRLPSLKRSVSINSDLISDSDSEDFYSVKSNMTSSTSLAIPLGHYRTSSASFRQSQSSSPRNSVSSMLSLTGRINKNLNIQSNSSGSSAFPSPVQSSAMLANPQAQPQFSAVYQNQIPPYAQQYQQPQHPGQHFYPPQPPFQQFPPQFLQQFPPQYANPQVPPPIAAQPYQGPGTFSKIPVATLEENLNKYYATFHACFPILPFDSSHLLYLTENINRSEDSRDIHIVELFNLALNNLNNFKETPINSKIQLFISFLSIYPFNNFDIALNDTNLVFFFSGLILLNYAILLNGDIYSLGISATMSIFNDFKVLENFNDLVHEVERSPNNSVIDCDNIKLYLPKVYFCLTIIDNLYAISFGIQKVVYNNELVKFLNSNIAYLLPTETVVHGIDIKPGVDIFKSSSVFNDLILARDQTFINADSKVNVVFNIPTGNDFSYHFLKLISEKFELKKYLVEINQFLTNATESGDIDELNENLLDYNFKLVRIVKRFSSIIINFANYSSTSTTAVNSSSPTNSDTSISTANGTPDKISTNNTNNMAGISPTSSSTAVSKQGESVLINPLLNISIAQLFKVTKLNKLIIDSLISFFYAQKNTDNHGSDLLNRCLKINNDLSISFNLLNLNLVNLHLGSVASNMIRKKLVAYKFNFDVQHITNGSNQLNLKNTFNLWKNEIQNNIIPFVEKENVEGWLREASSGVHWVEFMRSTSNYEVSENF